jgi:hypothetical protein
MQQSYPRNAFVALIRSKWTERVLTFVLIPALLLYSLWLPPVSLGARLFHTDYPLVTPDKGGDLTTTDGARLHVPAGAAGKRVRMRLGLLTQEALRAAKPDRPEALAAQALPTGILVQGPLYRVESLGQVPTRASLKLPVPTDLAATHTLDLYAWDGQAWRWLPSQLTDDGQGLVAELAPVPAFVAMATSQASFPRVALTASVDGVPLPAADECFTAINVSGVSVAGDGNLAGKPPTARDLGAPKGARLLLSISDVVDGVVRSDLVDNLLVSPSMRKNHIEKIVALAALGDYAGVEIEYDGIDPNLRSEFSAFASALAEALHASDRILAICVSEPARASAEWDTGVFDLQALGQSVDLLRLHALADPAAYGPAGELDKLLSWVTRLVDRRKLDLRITGYSHHLMAGQRELITYASALALLAPSISTSDPDNLLSPGQAVSFSLPSAGASPLHFDENAQVHWFTVKDSAGKEHTVWLESASSVARKLQYVIRYALGGISLDGILAKGNDPEIAGVLRAFQENLAPPTPQFALVWTVEDSTGKVVSQKVAPLSNAELSLKAPNNPGNYVVKAALSADGGKTSLGAGPQLAFKVPTPTFTPTATPTNTPSPTPTSTPTNTPTAKPTQRPTPKPASGTGSSVAPARGAGSFGYGIQADMITDGNHGRIINHIKTMGFTWVKQQVEWFRYNPAPGAYDWGPLDRLVDSCNANGINILFSVVKAPKWAQPSGDTSPGPPADPNTFGTFLREMATRYKGRVRAYEVWNEQNLWYEWGGRGFKLNAVRYVELLKVAYNAIKSVDPGAVVISGALTPTGWNDGDVAIDDRLYLEQMYQAGMARYCDAVGIHPSGYNNPPDADWRTWQDPSAPSHKGHPSEFFRGMVESYRNIMVKYGDGGKRLWATEFGWASVENTGAKPVTGYEYAADNTEAEQAQFIVRAYQMGRGYGFMGVMFLWNLNFAPVSGKADEKAAFGIVREDWSPRPAFAALRDTPK